ncbi:MAG: radical SAM protein [Candidatus Electrothrix sp. Rat3]|nr:radical SAM protein [Candidatus Electrothrix rattekaaiensis]
MFSPSAPISFSVELTNACPNSCQGCANSWNKKHQESLKDWKTVLDRIAPPEHRQKYAELIRLTGGEPTLHKDFPAIIEYIDSFDIDYAVFTSGRWQNDLLPLFISCNNLTGLLISLHGKDAPTHDAFVQSANAFEETCITIQRATEAGIEVFTNSVLTQDVCEQLDDIIALSQKLGANYAVFNRYLGPPHRQEPADSTLRDTIAAIEKYQGQGIQCRMGNSVPPCFIETTSEGANSGIEHCVISPQGWVRPDSTMPYVFGNLFEDSIETIWKSKEAESYRNALPDTCLQCVALPQCRGGYRLPTEKEQAFQPDRLMREPLTQVPVHQVDLNLQWKPIPLFKNIRKEGFGYLITRYNYSIPASEHAYPLLTKIDGTMTLAQLEDQFGTDCLDFIGYLYQNRFVHFQ